MPRPGTARTLLLAAPPVLFAVFLGLRLAAGSEGIPQAIRLVLAALAGSGFLVLAGAEALAPRLGREGAGRTVLFAWLALFGACVHDLFPPVASTRLVPVALFSACAAFLEPAAAAAVVLPSAVALAASGAAGGDLPLEAASAAGMALASLALALRFRRDAAPAEPGKGAPSRGEEALRRIVDPWQEEGRDGAPPPGAGGGGQDHAAELVEAGVHEILDAARTGSGADAVLFVVPRRDPSRPYSVACHSLGPLLPEVPSLPSDFPPLREALLFGQPHRAEEEEAGRWTVDGGGGRPLPLRRVAVLPVKGGGGRDVVGALCALGVEPGGWTDAALYLMAGSVQLLAHQMELAREVDAMLRGRRRQESLRLLVEGIARAAEGGEARPAGGGAAPRPGPVGDGRGLRQELYRLVTYHLHQMIGARRVLLVELDRASAATRGTVVARWPEGGSPPAGADLSSTYLARVFAQGVLRVVRPRGAGGGGGREERRGAGVPVIPREWGCDPGEEWILVPVRFGELFEGLLVCSAGHPTTRREEQDAHDVGDLLRMGLSHAVHVEALHSRATEDGLTGLMNRRTYLERVQHELTRVDRRHPCSLAMLDVDHFKRVNDTYGHPAGDEVLRRIASVIGKTIRKADYAGRYGGEEFSIFFHGMDRGAALQAAERLRILVREVKFDFGGKEVSVTVSLGLAAYPDHGTSAEELVRAADEALYRSKRGGRDRVTVADGR